VSQVVAVTVRRGKKTSKTFSWLKAKAKAYNTYTAPQAAYRRCISAAHFTDRADVQPIGRKLSMRPQTDLRPTSHMQP